MCGITGLFTYNAFPGAGNPISLMTSAIAHRGPDARGFYEDDHIAFGHNRLSIIDLSDAANQPMADHTGRYRIIFNGEIYNYREIKSRLSHQYPFSTHSDTEVILAAYSTWGAECLRSFAGMFAFAIWDNLAKELFLARDRLGVKPLYFCQSPNAFLFASEIRAILASGLVPKQIHDEAVSEFLQFQSVGFPNTIIRGIHPVEAGTCMTITANNTKSHKYWNITEIHPAVNFSNHASVKDHLKELLQRSVERRMVSDVPVAAFLSGGIDSSAIVGLMAATTSEQVNTFTVGFSEKEFDESRYAEIIAKKFNTQHQQIQLKAENFLDDLLPALDAMDTPTGDGVNSFVVCRAIRNNGIKVALSGVGGDELFAGYPFFRQYLDIMKFSGVWKPLQPFRYLLAKSIKAGNTKTDRYRQLLLAKSAGIASFYPAFRQILSHRMLSECTHLPQYNNDILREQLNGIGKMPLLSQVSVAEYLGYTRNTLLNDMDQMSMASSLEVREPFFDHELIEFVLDIPDKQKFPHYPKQLLVETLGSLLPGEIVHRPKQGFLFPWNQWMKNELKPFCEIHIRSMAERKFIKAEGLALAWKRFLNNDPSIRWMEIWLFVVLEYWLQKNNIE